MEYAIEFYMDENFLKRASSKAMWYKYTGTNIAAGIILIISLLTIGKGGAGSGFGLGFSTFYFYAWFSNSRRGMSIAQYTKDTEIKITVSHECLTMRTKYRYLQIRWPAFYALWRFKDIWLLVSKGDFQYIPIPVASMTLEVREFINGMLKEHGGKIEGNTI